MKPSPKEERGYSAGFRGTCIKLDDLDVELIQQGKDKFTVRYFKKIRKDLTYTEAAFELGCCIMHALACEFRLDNREKGEK